jgi:hypothetical protein
VGTREWERTFEGPGVLAEAGGERIDDRHYDGNHAIVQGREPHWVRQVKWLGAYWKFYHPLNLFRALRRDRTPLWKVRLAYQFFGLLATLWTTLKTLPFLLRLALGKRRYHEAAPPAAPLPVELSARAFSRLPASVPLPRRQVTPGTKQAA